jgi:phospho-N-acetylmuramoyl-pentapeptide-transferase
MLYKLFYSFQDVYSPFNVFRYITFRAALAVITALLISFILAPWVIKKLRALSMTQQIRDDGPRTHLDKSGTPTMGGIL